MGIDSLLDTLNKVSSEHVTSFANTKRKPALPKHTWHYKGAIQRVCAVPAGVRERCTQTDSRTCTQSSSGVFRSVSARLSWPRKLASAPLRIQDRLHLGSFLIVREGKDVDVV